MSLNQITKSYFTNIKKCIKNNDLNNSPTDCLRNQLSVFKTDIHNKMVSNNKELASLRKEYKPDFSNPDFLVKFTEISDISNDISKLQSFSESVHLVALDYNIESVFNYIKKYFPSMNFQTLRDVSISLPEELRHGTFTDMSDQLESNLVDSQNLPKGKAQLRFQEMMRERKKG